MNTKSFCPSDDGHHTPEQTAPHSKDRSKWIAVKED